MKGAPPAAGHLFWAAKKGSLEEVRALLQSGLDPSQGMGTDYYFGTKETPLTAAAKEGHVEVLRALLADDRVVESLPDALLHSAREGHVEVVKVEGLALYLRRD